MTSLGLWSRQRNGAKFWCHLGLGGSSCFTELYVNQTLPVPGNLEQGETPSEWESIFCRRKIIAKHCKSLEQSWPQEINGIWALRAGSLFKAHCGLQTLFWLAVTETQETGRGRTARPLSRFSNTQTSEVVLAPSPLLRMKAGFWQSKGWWRHIPVTSAVHGSLQCPVHQCSSQDMEKSRRLRTAHFLQSSKVM